jgi:hypothetical protein
MDLKDLADQVNNNEKKLADWEKVRKEIINRHEKASTVEEYITLLSLYKMLMDSVECQLPSASSVDVENIRELRRQDYNMLITRECTIGGSICIDTLYELTQRELEAGRMGPTHSLINLAVDAMAEPHYSREQLLRQQARIQKTESKNLKKRLSRIFRK